MNSNIQQLGHHKRVSTFENEPFVETKGLDDFFGFNATETKYLLEIKELKQMLSESNDLVDEKNAIITKLKSQIGTLQQEMNTIEQKMIKLKDKNYSLRMSNKKLTLINQELEEANQHNPLDSDTEAESKVNKKRVRLAKSPKKFQRFATFSGSPRRNPKPNPSKKRKNTDSLVPLVKQSSRKLLHSGSSLFSRPGLNGTPIEQHHTREFPTVPAINFEKQKPKLRFLSQSQSVSPQSTIRVKVTEENPLRARMTLKQDKLKVKRRRHSMTESLTEFMDNLKVQFSDDRDRDKKRLGLHPDDRSITSMLYEVGMEATDEEHEDDEEDAGEIIDVIHEDDKGKDEQKQQPQQEQEQKSESVPDQRRESEKKRHLHLKNNKSHIELMSELDFIAINRRERPPAKRESLDMKQLHLNFPEEKEKEKQKQIPELENTENDNPSPLSMQSNVNNFFVQELNINTMNQSNNAVSNVQIQTEENREVQNQAQPQPEETTVGGMEEKYQQENENLKEMIRVLQSQLKAVTISKLQLASNCSQQMQLLREIIQSLILALPENQIVAMKAKKAK